MRHSRRIVSSLFVVLAVCMVLFLALRPGFEDLRHQAAREAENQFDFDKAVAEYSRSLEYQPNAPATWLHLARVCRRNGDYDRALAALQESKKRAGATPEWILESEMLQAQLGQLQEVEASLIERVEKGHPESNAIREALMRGYIRVYRLPNAMYWAEQLIEKQSENPLAWLSQGMMFESVGNFAAAIQSYESALAKFPQHFQVRLHLGEVLLRLNRPAEARPYFESLFANRPDDSDVILGYASCRHTDGDNSSAAVAVDRLLEREPSHPRALALRGRIALHANDLNLAERFLQKAVKKLPADREINLNLANCLRLLDRNEEANHFLNRTKEIDADLKLLADASDRSVKNPTDPSPKHDAGVICLRNGQEAQAMRWFSGALQIDPSFKPTHAALADHYARTGAKELATKHRRLAGQ